MVQLQEITDEVAEKLTLESRATKAQAEPAQAEPAQAAPPPAKRQFQNEDLFDAHIGPDLPPQLAMAKNKTADEILAELNKSSLFMTDLEDNDEIAALQALAYEGSPLENASDFKERGNECFRERQWADAREFYNKGVAILVAEDRRRARGEPPKDDTDMDGNPHPDPDTPAMLARHAKVLGQLYGNRAACQLELKNYRACTLDCGAALRLDSANTKAWFRSARALLKLDKTDEAAEACRAGLAVDPKNTPLRTLAADVETRAATLAALRQRDADRAERTTRRAQRLKAVLRARGVRTRTTEQPPEMEDAAVHLEPADDGSAGLDVSASQVVYPTVLLYPLALQSDFIKGFNDAQTLADHLAYMLPLPWDADGQYTPASVACYMETIAGGLVKVGKKMPLGTILARASVEVVDELVKVFVVPRADADAWVQEFKEKKARS